MAKAYCSDAFREVCNRGVQVHGGIGFTWEHRLQLYTKRSKSSETTFGDATFHRERIASVPSPFDQNSGSPMTIPISALRCVRSIRWIPRFPMCRPPTSIAKLTERTRNDSRVIPR